MTSYDELRNRIAEFLRQRGRMPHLDQESIASVHSDPAADIAELRASDLRDLLAELEQARADALSEDFHQASTCGVSGDRDCPGCELERARWEARDSAASLGRLIRERDAARADADRLRAELAEARQQLGAHLDDIIDAVEDKCTEARGEVFKRDCDRWADVLAPGGPDRLAERVEQWEALLGWLRGLSTSPAAEATPDDLHDRATLRARLHDDITTWRERYGLLYYYCPTSGQVEDAIFGGFDMCCDRPELHRPPDAEATPDEPAPRHVTGDHTIALYACGHWTQPASDGPCPDCGAPLAADAFDDTPAVIIRWEYQPHDEPAPSDPAPVDLRQIALGSLTLAPRARLNDPTAGGELHEAPDDADRTPKRCPAEDGTGRCRLDTGHDGKHERDAGRILWHDAPSAGGEQA